jgi:hypothetical protein
MKLEILKQTVEAKTRRLSARWTVEGQADAQNMYGVDLEEELLQAVAQDLTVEIDQELLRSLRALPSAATAATRLTSRQFPVRPRPLLMSSLLWQFSSVGRRT